VSNPPRNSTKLPASQRAEESVLGAILKDPKVANEIVGAILEPEHFYFSPYRVVFEQIVERVYADDPIDPLTVAEAVSKKTSQMWGVDERDAVDRVVALTATSTAEDESTPLQHAALVKRHFDYRSLMSLAYEVLTEVQDEAAAPEDLAARLSSKAMQIATDQVVRQELLTFEDLGRNWVKSMNQVIALREAGHERGAHFGIRAIDEFTKGLLPTELLISGGEPGIGKSAVWWAGAINFCERQMKKPAEERVACLVLSLEMGEEPSSTRLAQRVGDIDGEKLRLGTIDRMELRTVAEKWAAKRELPLITNHSGMLRLSQLRAIVVEAIRKHNVGLVVIDHFRFLRPDEHFQNVNDADDHIVAFLKTAIAKDLNVAVVCLAHTTKNLERADKRPRMSDLRGSGMIAAFADFVCFVYRPWLYASDSAKERGQVSREDAEMIWAKARHSGDGTGEFYMNLATMSVV
jgi:replicative DNA helicase